MLMESIIIILAAIILVLCASLVLYARWNYGTLEAMGIPVVKPHWLLGSNYNYTKLYHHWEDVKRARELGPVYGVYNGRTPEVYIADPEIARKVFFQDSDHFANKREADFNHPIVNEILEVLNGEKWKTVRSSLSPLFTTGKIKQISDTVERISKNYVNAIAKDVENNGGRLKIEFKRFLGPFAIEVIGECFCGIKLENARDPNNSFVKNMRIALMEDNMKFDSMYNITLVFPFLLKLFPAFPVDGLDFLKDLVKNLIDEREKSGAKIPDTVSCLMELRQKCKTEEFKRLGITETTVYGQAFQFFVGSYHGLIHSFSDLCYHLATHPEAYDTLMNEVDSMLEKSNGKISYETVSELPYLTACISEGFRKSVGFFRPDRVCTKDWQYKDYRIKKGTEIFIPVYALHHNPEIFPEPDKFIPERFLSENKDKIPPCGFMPFGNGARQCVGMRFVYEFFKIFMVNILKEFRIETRDDTVWKEHPSNHFLVQKDPVYLDVVKR